MTLNVYGEAEFAALAEVWPEDPVAGRLFASYPWLRALRERMEGSHRWFVAADAAGSAGLMAMVLNEDIPSESKNPRRLLTQPCPSMRSARRLAGLTTELARANLPGEDQWFPALVVIYPGFECFPARRGAVSAALLAELVDGVLAEADRCGCRTVSFLFVPAAEAEFTAVLRERGLTGFYIATCSALTLPGTSYDDYLSSLDRRQRADARKQEAELAEAGVTVAEGPMAAELLDDLTFLRMEERRKHGRRLDEEHERAMLTMFLRSFPGRTRVTVARRDGEALGFSLLLAAEPGVEHSWTQGVRLTAANQLALYLSCTYYQPIRHAYARGVTCINFGYGTDRLKRLRGCRDEEFPGFILAHDARTRDHVRALADTALRMEPAA